jgi:hypothetical protein
MRDDTALVGLPGRQRPLKRIRLDWKDAVEVDLKDARCDPRFKWLWRGLK